MCDADTGSFECESIFSDESVKKKCVPTQTQIRQQLGPKLSDVFFENLSSEARAWLGLEPPLVGFDTEWVKPEARLDEKVSINPVPEPAVLHLKAFTHGSILEIGQRYIDMLENKHRLQMEEALRKQAEELEEECRLRMAELSEACGVDGSGQCKKVVATLMEHFDICFNELVATTQMRMRKECQLKIKEERAELAAYMLTQLQREVERRDLELCSDFHDILYSELNNLASRYVEQINEEREMAVQIIRETVAKYERKLKELKMEMEICSMIDICRAITQERIDSKERVRQTGNESKSKIEELVAFIDDLKAQNCALQEMATNRLKRLMQWGKKVQTLLLEFQKFINFALEAVPGQAEFLLSMEKLMLKQFPEDSFLSPEDYLHFKNCLKDKLPPSEEEEEEKPIMVETDEASTESEIQAEDSSAECCQSIEYQEKTECNLTFDYYKFKSMLVRRFASNLLKPKPKKKPKKTVCLWKKKSKEISVDESSELYQMLTLAGETEKGHLVPVDCFLQKRLKAVRKICQDDPEFAKMFLGCSKN